MFKYLIKGLLAGIAVKMLGDYRNVSVQLLKIEAVKSYVLGVRVARDSAIGLIRMGLVIALIGLGALLLHIGLFLLLPWSLAAKAVLAMILGGAYVTVGVVALWVDMSEKTWLKMSGAAELLETVTAHGKGDDLPPRR